MDCASCGAEAELHSGGRCWSCVLGAAVDQLLTSPRTGVIDAALQPVAAALKSMTRANSGLTWINQRHVKGFLAELAARPVITHDILDALPAHPTREHVRGLLVEHGALPGATSDVSATRPGANRPCSGCLPETTATSCAASSAGTCCAG